MAAPWKVAIAAAALLFASGAAEARSNEARWIASWGSAQMVPEGENALPADAASAITLRQVVRISAGGTQFRVRLSNRFGTRPLPIGAAHLAAAAKPGTPAIGAGAPLTFAGRRDAVIPAGAELYSDPVALSFAPGADLAISLYLPETPEPQTGHPGARATSFLLSGNHVAEPDLPGARTTTRWYVIADVEVAAPANAGTVVAIGDSITDGYGVMPERNTRWTDVFAQRLRSQPATRNIGVVNAGIGGNRVLLDGLGPNLMARFDRDVIARSGVRWAIVLEGINDLGTLTRDAPATPEQHQALVQQVTAAFRELAARAHAHGIKLIGGTVMPFGGNSYYHPAPELEAARQAINSFIRTSGTFDAVIDFDQLMRDPAHPDRLAPALDSGDHLHPSEAGYRKMGEAIPLNLFTQSCRPASNCN
jgi:lysophospholipase L1-like esterase